MALLDYTTYDDIRAALGVSSDEIEDATLSLSVYEFGLLAELEEIDPTLHEAFTTVAEVCGRTEEEERFFQATSLFATYAVALQATAALPLFSPKDISDGKATVSRYADSPYKEVIKRVEQQYSRCKSRLEKAFATYNSAGAPSITSRTFFSVSVLDSDPITGS